MCNKELDPTFIIYFPVFCKHTQNGNEMVDVHNVYLLAIREI